MFLKTEQVSLLPSISTVMDNQLGGQRLQSRTLSTIGECSSQIVHSCKNSATRGSDAHLALSLSGLAWLSHNIFWVTLRRCLKGGALAHETGTLEGNRVSVGQKCHGRVMAAQRTDI